MPPKKKKKKKGRARAAGVQAPQAQAVSEASDPQDKRRERLEARREAKARAMAQQRRRDRTTRIVRLVTTVVVVGAVVWFLFLRNNIPDAIAGHEIEHFDTFTSESASGTLHSGDPITYESLPPTSGLHRPLPADCGVHNQQIPDENMVHTLEHGSVGILYQPDTPIETVRRIEGIVKDFDDHVFSEPYPNMEAKYAVVAWAHRMLLEEYDEAAIEEFVDVFRNGGDAPEAGQACDNNADNSFEASPSPTPSPSPADEATPHHEDKKEKKED